MQVQMTRDRLLGLYLEALDESTGFTYTITELKQHTVLMTYDELKQAYDKLPDQFKYH